MRAAGVIVGICLLAACGRFGFDGDPGDDVIASPRLSLELAGTGAGMVVGTGGIQCTESCEMDVSVGAEVSLRGLATSGDWLAGWSGPCGGNFDCDFVVDADVTVEAEFLPRPNRVFVTEADFDGALGGLAAADTLCGDAAIAGGLDGTFIAYLSASTASVSSRLTGSRGWIRVDGAPVADIVGDFASGPVIFSVRIDEHGNDIGTVPVFTGTQGGNTSANTCLDWTSADPANSADGLSTSWGSHLAVSHATKTCDERQHLMCIETGKNIPVQIKPDTGRLAFLTVGTWAPGGGISSADVLCADEATAAQVPGTFLAALATSTGSIESRFTPGPPWKRVDGVRLLRGDGLFDVDFLDVAPEVDIAGSRSFNDFWTGTLRWNQTADVGDNCGDWSISDVATTGHMGYSSQTNVSVPAKLDACNSAIPLLCLQQ